MNRVLSIFLILFLTGASLVAQDQKIGFIDSDLIMENMPEYSGIEQRLNLLSEGWEDEIRELESEIEELEQEFEAREILFTDEMKEQRQNEISNLKLQRDQFVQDKFGPEGEYFTVQQELLAPVQRQIFDAVTAVAERQNFDYVFDRAQETRFLYTKPDWNLTEDVMLELGMDADLVRN